MLEWLYQNFKPGKNYLVCQNDREQINSYLLDHLVAPVQVGRKHNLWGKVAERLPVIGNKLGWVPNKVPAVFLCETVALEIADAIAASENQLLPGDNHLKSAMNLLSRFNLTELAHRKPFLLSEGESKILWFLTQWVKQPDFLIIGHLPSNLSKKRVEDIINFLIEEENNVKTHLIIILGYHPESIDWCKTLFSLKDWVTISQWPG